MDERDELVAGLLELADQMEQNPRRVPLDPRAKWGYEPSAMTPQELRRVAEMLESGE